jgi:hypothetical protein
MSEKKFFYIVLTPILIIIWLFGLSGATSEFDQDNFDFKEEYGPEARENFVNTFPENGQNTTEEEKKSELAGQALIDQDVLFTPQAPLAKWSDPRQQDGCEEASVIMAMSWLGRESFSTLSEAEEKIINLSLWQEENYGSYVDTSAFDTSERLIKKYYNYENVEVIENATPDSIKKALWLSSLVLAPCDGRKLGNPNFTAPGPKRHMVLIRGYDEEKKEFITNDPGTRKGEAYRYNENILFGAIRDYPSGDRVPITANEKTVIVINPR